MYMVTYQVLKVWTQHHFVPVPSHTFSNTKCGKLLKELSSCIFKIAGWSEKSLRVDSMFTCSVINNNALSNIWLPSNAVMAMNRNKPSSTIVGIRVSGVGSISRESAISKLEIKPDNLVSLTFTMLKIRKFSTRMLNW